MTKTKEVWQEVKKISEVVNIMQTEKYALDKLHGEINSINSSIDAIIKRASDDGGKAEAEAENERMKQRVQDGSIPSTVVDSGTASNAMKPGDPCTQTGRRSSKQYKMATGHIISGGEEALMDHEVREPTRTCDIVPGITEDLLISTRKFADAGYVILFDGEEVNIYDASNNGITITKRTIIRGWRDKNVDYGESRWSKLSRTRTLKQYW